MIHPQLNRILPTLRTYLKQAYGDRLAQIILFGSQARGDAAIDSDIDILIVLQDSVNAGAELKRLSEFIANLCLEYNTLISCVFMSAEQFQQSNTPLLLNVRQEGITI
jgi:uncharacterized protein